MVGVRLKLGPERSLKTRTYCGRLVKLKVNSPTSSLNFLLIHSGPKNPPPSIATVTPCSKVVKYILDEWHEPAEGESEISKYIFIKRGGDCCPSPGSDEEILERRKVFRTCDAWVLGVDVEC